MRTIVAISVAAFAAASGGYAQDMSAEDSECVNLVTGVRIEVLTAAVGSAQNP